MPEDYQDLVLATYKKKQGERGLPLNLLKPTTVKLRRECLKKYDASEEAKDVFSDFFDVDKIESDFTLMISKADDGDFRPLLNHIKGITSKTDEKNSELLAWLIDFQPRPSTSYYKSLCEKPPIEEELIVDEPIIEGTQVPSNDKGEVHDPIIPIDVGTGKNGTNIGLPTIDGLNTKQLITNQKIVIACVVLLLTGIFAFQIWKNATGKISTFNTLFSSGKEKCMYWTGDHYQPVSCEENISGASIIPIDHYKVAHFKKITQPDTLTPNALGKVWYAKQVGKPDFYTDSADHPTDGNRRLLPLTSYMLTKYVSYDRYRLNLAIWSISIISFILLFGMGAIYLGRKVKSRRASL